MEYCKSQYSVMSFMVLTIFTILAHCFTLCSSYYGDHEQRCCFELQVLQKVFGQTEYECLFEDCIAVLQDMRTATINSTTSCPLPEEDLCQHLIDNSFRKTPSSQRTMKIVNVDLAAWNILRVVDTRKWQNCVIVYDKDSWPVLDTLTLSLSERRMDFILYDVTGWTDRLQYRSLLEETWGRQRIKAMIILADVIYVEKLFREARAYDVTRGRTSGLRMFSQWIVASPGDKQERVRVAARELDNVVAILETPQYINTNSSVDIHNNTTNLTVECVTSEVSTLMYVRINETLMREFQSATVVTSDYDLIINDTFPNVRHLFNNRTLTIGTKEWSPFVIKNNGTFGGTVYAGLCMDMVRELSVYLNFSYVFVEPPWEEGWGDLMDDGNWTGLVGLLQRQEVDLVVAPLSHSTHRVLVMDATVPFSTNKIAAVFKMPDPLLDKWRTYLEVFRGEVLLCILTALIGTTFLIHIMAWINPASRGCRKKKHKTFPGPSIDDGFWYLYGALLSQGGVRLPQSGSGRMLIASWWLFSIAVGATYSGNLIAFLTVKLEDKPFDNLAELLENGDYYWGSLGKTATTRLLMESKNRVLRGLGQGILEKLPSDPSVLDLDHEVHLAKVAAGDYAFITDSISADVWVRDQCDLSMVTGDGVSMPLDSYAVYLPRHSDFTQLINEYVMRIVESGLTEKWKQDWWTDSLRCAKDIVSSADRIFIHDVQSVFYAGLIGFGLALISLGCEFLFHRNPKLKAWASKITVSCVAHCTEHPEKTPHEIKERRGSCEESSNNENENNNRSHHQNWYLRDPRTGSTREATYTPEVLVDQSNGSAYPGMGEGFDDINVSSPSKTKSAESAFDFGRARAVRFNYNTIFSPVFASQEDFGRSELSNSSLNSTDKNYGRSIYSHVYSTDADFGRSGNLRVYCSEEDFGRGELEHVFSHQDDFGRRVQNNENQSEKNSKKKKKRSKSFMEEVRLEPIHDRNGMRSKSFKSTGREE